MMRRYVLLMLLAWLPIQASAMPWLAFQCEQHGSGMHYEHAAQHAGHAHHADASDHGAAVGDDPDALNDVHTCCPHFSGVVHSLPFFAGANVATDVAPHSPAHLHDFIPDLPKRPPLARLV